MKYLVVKGWLGFGDRLESLKMCVRFAFDNKLQIYVDWTDSIWSHGSESFYSYFKLVGISQINSLDDIPEDAVYFPEFWKNKIKEPFSHELWKKNPSCDLGILGPHHLKNNADVLVVSSIGRRAIYPDSSFFSSIFRVVHPQIIEEVLNRQRTKNLRGSIGIHIRGTDRIKRQGRELPIQWMALHAFTHGAMSGAPMVAVSDDKNSFDIWKRFFPQTILLSSLSLQESAKNGNHNVKKEDLKNTKDELNIDCLIDFFTLASCQRIMSTYKDSRFFHEAMRLSPFVNNMLSS